MDAKDILKIREKFTEDTKPFSSMRASSHNAFGGFILEDGSYRLIGRWICHGWLQAHMIDERVGKPIKYVLSAVMALNEGVTKAQALSYIDWLVNRSPWASVFVDKDAQSVYHLGYLVDANYPANFITSAMIASRFITEAYVSPETFAGRNKLFFALLDAGVPETESFLFSHYYSSSGKKVFPVHYSPISTGHTVFASQPFDKDYFKNFLEGTPKKLHKGFLSKGKGYTGDIFALWGPGKDYEVFSNLMKSLKPARMSVKEDLHIFRRVREDQIQYDTMEDFLSVLRQLKGLLDA